MAYGLRGQEFYEDELRLAGFVRIKKRTNTFTTPFAAFGSSYCGRRPRGWLLSVQATHTHLDHPPRGSARRGTHLPYAPPIRFPVRIMVGKCRATPHLDRLKRNQGIERVASAPSRRPPILPFQRVRIHHTPIQPLSNDSCC